MTELFGTDGVRGVANRELTGELAYTIGRAASYYLTRDYYGGDKAQILIGKDTRISGDMLEAALIAGITSVGVDVIRLGIIPTPGVSFLTDITGAQAGIMISASHNPIADNGIKFFNAEGLKLTDKEEEEIEELIFSTGENIPYPTHEKLGMVEDDISLQARYVEHLVDSVNVDLEGLQVVLDCANGAAYEVAPAVLSALGVEVEVINDHPDGEKINVNSGSTYPRVVKNRVIREGADAGIAHDGDADRLVMVDEKGNILDGDYIMAILALDLLHCDNLQGKSLVTTRYSNYGLKELLDKRGASLVTARNGDRYVLAEMLTGGYNLGGEKSGHIIYLDYNKTGDGILTAIQVLEVMRRTGKSLNELARVLEPWPQKMSNVQVQKKQLLPESQTINELINRAEEDLGDQGRIFIRASGTEPVIRVMLECKDRGKLSYWEQELTAVISKELN